MTEGMMWDAGEIVAYIVGVLVGVAIAGKFSALTGIALVVGSLIGFLLMSALVHLVGRDA